MNPSTRIKELKFLAIKCEEAEKDLQALCLEIAKELGIDDLQIRSRSAIHAAEFLIFKMIAA